MAGKGRGGSGGAAVLEAPPTEGTADLNALYRELESKPTLHASAIGVAFTTLALADIAESPHNPRKHFDPLALEELTASIREQGIWEPLLVRPHPSAHGVYELASGHRRYRAAKAAGLTDVPALIRDLDDATFIEVLTVANLQREDVHPLEEADGYAEMMKSLGWDVPTIARKVGKGETYVYDRLKFHVLIPAVRDLFFANRITAAHATELSRLKPAQQERALDPGREGGLWQSEGAWGEDAFDFELTGEDPYAGMKVRTVRELRAWVQTHTRFDAAAADPVLFSTVAAVQAAVEQKLKVVEITRSHAGSIRPEVKGEAAGRILSPVSWKRADGQPEDGEPTERCEYSERVLGVVVEGAGQGESFAVCIAREKCKRHWSVEMRDKAKRAKERERAGSSATASRTPSESSWERDRRLREEASKRLAPLAPVLRPLLVAKVKAASVGKLVDFLTDDCDGDVVLNKSDLKRTTFPRGKSADDFLRCLVWTAIEVDLENDYDRAGRLTELCRAWGLDFKRLEKEHAPAAEKPAAATKPAKAAKRKGGKK